MNAPGTHSIRLVVRWLKGRLVADENGSMVVYSMLAMLVLVTFAGMVADAGLMVVTRNRNQASADAAATGALEYIWLNSGATESSAASVAAAFSQSNTVYSTTVTTTLQTTGIYSVTTASSLAPFTMTLRFLDSTGTPTSTASSVMTVTAAITNTWTPRFLGALGYGTVGTHSYGTAAYSHSTNSALYLLGTSGDDLSVSAGTKVGVTGGGILDNSSTSSCPGGNSSGGAMWVQANAGSTITATGTIGVVGSACQTSTGSGYSPTPTTVSSVRDPFALAPTPTLGVTGQAIPTCGNCTNTITPGTYVAATIGNSEILQLQGPGTFVIIGNSSTFTVQGSAQLTSSGGVTLYFTCGTTTSTACTSGGQTGAGFAVTHGGGFTISAPTSGSYAGMAIMFDRNNNAAINLSGGGAATITGSVYAKSSTMTLDGSGSGTILNSRLVLSSMVVQGGSNISVSFNQGQNFIPTAGVKLAG
jgi:hypothetical protein